MKQIDRKYVYLIIREYDIMDGGDGMVIEDATLNEQVANELVNKLKDEYNGHSQDVYIRKMELS